jgi:deoxyadenosine/deoxycytidine kinase
MPSTFTYTIVSIEGNIGSGKSTLQANLRDYYKNNHCVVFMREPVDEWSKIQDSNGVTILEKFYADQYKYSFPFQMMAYVSRLKVLRDTLEEMRLSPLFDGKHAIIITERSLYTDKMVFAKMLFDSGKIEDVNYQIYLNWFDTFSAEFLVQKIVYMKTSPNMCYKRIHIRAREGEEKIPLEYLISCDDYHDTMLDIDNMDCVCSKQLVLNGDVDIYSESDQLDNWLKMIDLFINNNNT